MGRSCRTIQVDKAIALAKKGHLESWSTNSTRMSPKKVTGADLCDDGRVTLYYGQWHHGVQVNPHSGFQEFSPTAAAKKAW